jgi:DNA transformation protein and related proteins
MSDTTKSSSDKSSTDKAVLEALPGLGAKSVQALHDAGITSVVALRELGAVRAFAQVKAAGLCPSLNLLWALEGALTDTSWRIVSRTQRTRLLFELDGLAAERSQALEQRRRRASR